MADSGRWIKTGIDQTPSEDEGYFTGRTNSGWRALNSGDEGYDPNYNGIGGTTGQGKWVNEEDNKYFQYYTPEEKAHNSQVKGAKEFRSNLPGLQSQMAERLTAQSNRNLSENQGKIQQANSRRGLAYGGLNEGLKQKQAAISQSGLASSIQSSNMGLLGAADQMDSDAIGTGVKIQQQQQQIQNQIYQQALAQQSAGNQVAGALGGLGAAVGSIWGPAGTVAGGLIGTAVGSAVGSH